MSNLCIIPARSGSKGLKNKNIKLLSGIPLIAYTIKAAIESNVFDEIMVSTDSYEYAEISKEYGACVPFLRSEKTSSDNASSWDVVKEVLSNYKIRGIVFDNVFLLQPTSPLRECGDIIGAYELFNRKNADFVVSVCETDHSPLWCNTISQNLSLKDFISEKVRNIPRQMLPTYYRFNGAIYIIKTDYLFNTLPKDFYGDNSFAYIMDKRRSIDIDDEIDFMFAETIINSNIPKEEK